MSTDNQYINEDGSVKDEIVEMQKLFFENSAKMRGQDPDHITELMKQVDEDGFVILENIISEEVVETIRKESAPFLTHEGRTEFEGHKTRRIYSVIEKTFCCNPIVEHPLILALLDRILAPNYLLSQLQVIDVLPGEIRQPLHHDDGFYPIARPRKPFGAACIWSIDDFTAENGATMIYPGSHKWGDVPPSEIDIDKMVPAVMPSGSAIFFLGTAWHCAGANNTDKSRLAATTQYCEPWARQQENYSLAISRERAKQCSEQVQSLLGYSMLFPFIGFVNGRDPKRLLED